VVVLNKCVGVSDRAAGFRGMIDPGWRSMTVMLRVTKVEPLDGYQLRVTFNDGVVRDVDCAFLLHRTLGGPLRDPDYFRQASVDEEARTAVWPNGLNPAPEVLYSEPQTHSRSKSGSQQAAA
jgi:hypothetical protein